VLATSTANSLFLASREFTFFSTIPWSKAACLAAEVAAVTIGCLVVAGISG